MAGFYYNLADNDRRDFVHLAIGEEWEIGCNNSGGPTLKTRIDDPSIAEVLSDSEISPGVSKIKVRGKGNGNSLVRGIAPDGSEQALTQFVVRRAPQNVIYHWPDSGLSTDLDMTNLGTNKDPEFIITLNLLLEQIPAGELVNDWDINNDPHSKKKPFKAQPWKPSEWANFTSAVKRQGERKFDNRFWLRSPNQYWPMVKNHIRYHVACRFKVNLVGASVAPFAAARKIRVIKVLPKDAGFRSDSGTYNNYDINKTWSYGPNGALYGQISVVHEIWHALGGDHYGQITHNPRCPTSNIGAPACYCAAPSDCGNVSGLGMSLAPLNGSPWQNYIAEHTEIKPEEWKVSIKRIPPDPV